MKNLLSCDCVGTWGVDLAALVLRLAAGFVFLMHGWQKVGNLDGFGGMLGSLGVPAPEVMAMVVLAVEVGGGALLIAGLFTHWAAKFLAIDMLTAFALVHVENGFWVSDGGYELVMVLFAMAVALSAIGAGAWSLDRMLFGEKGK